MSLGGFAGGMASAFQKALDREQEEKMEARREKAAQLRQAASFAHNEKLYTRRLMDDERKSLRETEQGLKAIFGSGPDSLPYVQAWMQMGSAGIEQLKELKEFAKEKRVPFKSYLDLSYPINDETGELFTQDNYGTIDLGNTIETMIKRRVGDDPDAAFIKPQIGGVIKPYEQEYSIYSLSFDEVNQEIARVEDNIEEARSGGVPTVELNKELDQLNKWRDTILKNEADMHEAKVQEGDSTSAKRLIAQRVNRVLTANIPNAEMIEGFETGTFLTMRGDQFRYLNAFEKTLKDLNPMYEVYKKKQKDGVSGITLFESALLEMNTMVSRKNSLMDQMVADLLALDPNLQQKIINNKPFPPNFNKNTLIGKAVLYSHDNEPPTVAIVKGIGNEFVVDEAKARQLATQAGEPERWRDYFNPYGFDFYAKSTPFTKDSISKLVGE
jgi:chromosome segregation ATPase